MLGSGDGLVKIWEVGGKTVLILSGHNNFINYVTFYFHQSKSLASCSVNGSIIIWDAFNGDKIFAVEQQCKEYFILSGWEETRI